MALVIFTSNAMTRSTRSVAASIVVKAFLMITAISMIRTTTAMLPRPEDNDPPDVEQIRRPNFEAAGPSTTTPAVCYSPFHNPEYPLNNAQPGDVRKLADAMAADFAVIRSYFTVARTYYSSYYGVSVTPAAAANGVKLYLGVYMTTEAWYADQVAAAVAAVKQFPDTVVAILVGNENVQPAGPFSARDVADRVVAVRARVKSETGRTVPVGTVQRAAEWLETGDRAAIRDLADACDIIGVNIYPFFDANYDARWPLAIVDGIWAKMLERYPASKLRLTETGFPTAGAPLAATPSNVPSLANAKGYYAAFRDWRPAPGGGGGEAFWFMFFDRSAADDSMGVELEKHFGFFTDRRVSKGSSFPLLLSLQQDPSISYPSATTAPATTTTPPTPVPASSTTAPVSPQPTSNSPAPPVLGTPAPVFGSNVCRVKKVFVGAL
ncbi:hypothetical protein PybrP1_012973 [[Pythium] brassicae (nom. inval.)]|nr:hypothetical protein PybrP1_012973 [[Pythium] brassicae (nom. inval.)]